jgi:hypothetical protein
LARVLGQKRNILIFLNPSSNFKNLFLWIFTEPNLASRSSRKLSLVTSKPGLPDGLFSNQKFQFG